MLYVCMCVCVCVCENIDEDWAKIVFVFTFFSWFQIESGQVGNSQTVNTTPVEVGESEIFSWSTINEPKQTSKSLEIAIRSKRVLANKMKIGLHLKRERKND